MNVVYKIPCADCKWNYVGETGRCLHTRKKEHIRNTKVFKSGSNVASHAWLEGHTINFENARVIDRGNSRVRKTLESWHTAITSQADNNSKQLPRQYSILLLSYHHKYSFCIYLYSFVITYIFLPSLFTLHFLKIADWQSKAQCFFKTFNQRTFSIKKKCTKATSPGHLGQRKQCFQGFGYVRILRSLFYFFGPIRNSVRLLYFDKDSVITNAQMRMVCHVFTKFRMKNFFKNTAGKRQKLDKLLKCFFFQ